MSLSATIRFYSSHASDDFLFYSPPSPIFSFQFQFQQEEIKNILEEENIQLLDEDEKVRTSFTLFL